MALEWFHRNVKAGWLTSGRSCTFVHEMGQNQVYVLNLPKFYNRGAHQEVFSSRCLGFRSSSDAACV